MTPNFSGNFWEFPGFPEIFPGVPRKSRGDTFPEMSPGGKKFPENLGKFFF